MKYRFLLLALVLLGGCEKYLPCTSNGLGTREDYNGTLRTNGVYIADSGNTRNGEYSDYGSIYFLFQNGLFHDLGSFSVAERADWIANGTVPVPPTLDYGFRRDLGIFFQRDAEINITSWATTYGRCNPVIVEKGTVLDDTTFQINYYEDAGSEVAVFKTLRFYPTDRKPDSSNPFIK